MRSRRIIGITALGLVLLSLAAGGFAYARLARIVERQEVSATWLELALSESLEPGRQIDARKIRTFLDQLRSRPLPAKVEAAALDLGAAIAPGSVPADFEGDARAMRRALLQETRRVLRRSEARTAALGENLLQIALIGGPVLAALAAALLASAVHWPLRKAGRASTATDAAKAVSGLSSDLAELLRGLDAERQDRLIELVRASHLAALGTFSAEIAHEVRNPLTTICGIAESAQRRLASRDGEFNLTSELERIAEESQRAGRLLRDLLNLAPRDSESPQRFDVVLEAREVARLVAVRSHVDASAIDFRGLPHLVILGHPSRWRQLIFNLLVNAIDATKAAQRVGPRSVGVTFSRSTGEAVVEVRDGGVGFDESSAHRLFEPFFSTKGKEGSGLGLFICEGLARESGSTIEARSPGRGEGATFRVRIPLKSQGESTTVRP